MADCQLVYKARESFALSLAAEEFASKYFRYGGRIGGILEVPAGMTKKGADNLEAGYRKTYEKVDNAFKTVILRDGAKFHQAQFTPEQTQNYFMANPRKGAVYGANPLSLRDIVGNPGFAANAIIGRGMANGINMALQAATINVGFRLFKNLLRRPLSNIQTNLIKPAFGKSVRLS